MHVHIHVFMHHVWMDGCMYVYTHTCKKHLDLNTYPYMDMWIILIMCMHENGYVSNRYVHVCACVRVRMCTL